MFPALLAAVTGAGLAVVKLSAHVAGWTAPAAGGAGVQPIHFWHQAAQVGSTVLLFSLGAFLAWSVAEMILYGLMNALGRSVTREEFEAFLVREARARPDLYRGLLGLRPGTGILKGAFDQELRRFGVFAFTLPNAIYLRPELIRLPWLFRAVLRHELYHYRQGLGRAPPRGGGVLRSARGMLSEAAAHVFEFLPLRRQLPQGYLLERVLNLAQLSLKLTSPYDVLLAGAAQTPMTESDFRWVSGGQARVRSIQADGPTDLTARVREALRDPGNQGRFRALLLDGAAAWIPQGQDLKLLEMVFRRMDQHYQERIAKLRQNPLSFNPKGNAAPQFWNEVRTPPAERIEVIRLLYDLYASLQDKGVALLPFAPGDPALGPIERLFRHWANNDNGYFRTVRVDLAEGGHVLVAQKTEPRVRVYLKPTNGAQVATSIVSIYRDPVKRQAAESVLRHLGLEAWLPTFQEIGLEVVHVQGEDTGDTMVYVSVPRRSLRLIEAIVAKGQVAMVKSEANFQPHGLGNGLHQSVPRQKGPEAWQNAGKAKGAKVYVVDTGAWTGHPDFGDRVSAEDLVDEGPQDWHGHGTQTMGDALAGGEWLKGPAPEAAGVMEKVFPRGSGASDGEIRAAWSRSQQGGGDVINMSLGSPGSPDAPLARDASGLTQRKNAKGEFPIVVASAGNSGPDAETIGQPAAGEEVIAVGAATKGDDPANAGVDAVPDVALYSASGWAYADHGYGLRRPVWKPEIIAMVGTVNSPDEEGDVYKYGLTSPRSRDAEPTPADSPDGLHTRAVGTSMAGPQVAGAAALLKSVVKAAGQAVAAWIWEHLPFSVKMWLMVSAEDMRVPVAKQGAGLLDIAAAVKAARASLRAPGSGGLGSEWLSEARRAVDLPRQVFEQAAAAGRRTAEAVRNAPETQALAKKAAREAAKQVLRLFRMGIAAAGADPRQVRETVHALAREAAQVAAERVLKQAAAAASQKAAGQAFKEAATAARPELERLLGHPVWIVRAYAAFAAIGLKDPEALPALANAAAGDADARVRQLALLAIGEAPSRRVDAAIRAALQDPSPEVRAYAALALARHGDAEAVTTLLGLAGDADKRVRYTASWAMGYLGKAADAAVTARLAQAVQDAKDQDSNRHEALAALGRLAANDQAFTPAVFPAVLESVGTQDQILTGTAVKSFFSKVGQNPALRRMLNEEPARAAAMEFLKTHRSYANKRGALGDLVRLLAKVTGTELGSPLPSDPSGQGIPGVDDNLGPVHLVVEVPQGRAMARTVLALNGRGQGAGVRGQGASDTEAAALQEALDSIEFPRETVAGLGGTVRAVMKEGFVSLEVPAHSVPALADQMALRGFLVRRAGPLTMFLKDTGPASGLPEVREQLGITGVGAAVLVADEGLDPANPAFAGKVLGVVNTSGQGAVDDVSDESVGHGTHVSNIAAGSRRPDGNPNLGRAPDALVIAAKVLGAMGGSEATVMEGVSAALQILDDANAKLAAYWKAKDAGAPASALASSGDLAGDPDPGAPPAGAPASALPSSGDLAGDPDPGAPPAGGNPALPENPALQRAAAAGVRRIAASINLSLGGPGQKDSALNLQLRRIHVEGRAMVSVAAGNDGPGEGTANETSPANEWSVKTVGALTKEGSPAFYSSPGTDADPIVNLAHYGGDVVVGGRACPFLPGGIVSALAAKAAEAAARCVVPHDGRPADQAMSGTSMASPHSAGDDALVLQEVQKHFTAEELAQAKGLTLWLDQVAYRKARPLEGQKPSKVGAGLRDVKAELAFLDVALKDKPKVLAEAAELYKKAKERDKKESAIRWAGVGVPASRRSLWRAVWEALKTPFTRTIAEAARRGAGNGISRQRVPATPAAPAVELDANPGDGMLSDKTDLSALPLTRKQPLEALV